MDYLTVDFDWKRSSETVKLMILNMNGKTVWTEATTIQNGNNQLRVNVEKLAQGNYFLEIRGPKWKIISDQFVKMLH